MRLNKGQVVIPGNLYAKYMAGKYRDEGYQDLQKAMPYLDPKTGLNNRMVSRDPLTGLGDFGEERDVLMGSQIQRKQDRVRDIIRLEGDLGAEYNCFYTTKDLKCKPREERNPITLQGDLGDEMDVFHPTGRYSNSTPDASGLKGDRSMEPVTSKARDNHWIRTDPITHTTAESGQEKSRTVRQYNERWVHRDPILHRYGSEDSNGAFPGGQMRHYGSLRSINPITHLPSTWFQKDTTQNESSQRPTRGTSVRAKGSYSADRIRRNPITGEGMRPEDYSDLLTLPRQYHCRYKDLSADKTDPNTKQVGSKVQPPRRNHITSNERPVHSKPKVEDTPTSGETIVKKVVRPRKKPSEPVIEQKTNDAQSTHDAIDEVSTRQPEPQPDMTTETELKPETDELDKSQVNGANETNNKAFETNYDETTDARPNQTKDDPWGPSNDNNLSNQGTMDPEPNDDSNGPRDTHVNEYCSEETIEPESNQPTSESPEKSPENDSGDARNIQATEPELKQATNEFDNSLDEGMDQTYKKNSMGEPEEEPNQNSAQSED